MWLKGLKKWAAQKINESNVAEKVYRRENIMSKTLNNQRHLISINGEMKISAMKICHQ